MQAWLFAFPSLVLSQLCPEEIQGDGHCDRVCMSASHAYDSGSAAISDCAETCAAHCSPALLGNSVCDQSCNTWDCAWDSGDCRFCGGNCLVAAIGDGNCDQDCDVWDCGRDLGDCASASEPAEVFVSAAGGSQGDGSRENPLNDLTETLMRLFLPYNRVTLLPGTHLLNPNALSAPLLLAQSGLVETTLQAETCCEEVTIRLTRHFASFLLSHSVTFSNIRFLGTFDVRPDCWSPSCLYCPYTYYNATVKQWRNDRGEEIAVSDYAPSSFCEAYHDKVFITVTEPALVTFANVTFESFEQQLNALVLNQCGTLRFLNVSFDGNMANPTGLKGGLIQHVCPSAKLPYDCGAIEFEGGSVSYLNDGYEYRPDIIFTGFLNVQGIRLLRIVQFHFSFSFAMIGYAIDTDLQIRSALIYVTNFREMEVAFCTFEYGIAEVSAAIFIDSNFAFPLVVDAGEATEQKLTHLVIRDSQFFNNTSQRGALLHFSFKGDNINIRLLRLSFAANIALLGIVYIKCATINDEDAAGVTRLVDGQSVFFPRRTVSVSSIDATENYSGSLFLLNNVANFAMEDCNLLRNGESTSGVTMFSDVLAAFIVIGRPYASIQPYFPVQLVCTEIISLVNVLNLTFLFNKVDTSYCPTGVSGLSLSGSVGEVEIHDASFENCEGSGALTLSINQPVHLYSLLFRNNTNRLDKDSVCFDISPQVPTDVSISDSVFSNNHGWFSTVVYAENTLSLTLTRVVLTGNTANYTCAGVLFNPYPTGPSRLVVTDSRFEDNAAKSYGVVTVMDADGLLSGNTLAKLQVVVTNSTFRRNTSASEGACITVSSFVTVAAGSEVRNCSFEDNEALSGTAITATYDSGVLLIQNCSFLRNYGETGAAIYLSQFYTVTVLTEVRVSHCYFESQRGNYAIAAEGDSQVNDIYSEANVFAGGEGAFSLTASRLHDSSSLIFSQVTQNGGAIEGQIISEVYVSNLTARNNTARNKGGVFFLTAGSFLSLADSAISENRAGDDGGVVYSDGDSIVAVTNTTISGNAAKAMASALFISPGSLTMTQSLVTNGHAGEYSSVYLSRCLGAIVASEFRNNTSATDSPGVVLSSCDFEISASVFEDQQATAGAFIVSIDHNSLRLVSCTFRRGTVTSQGGAVSATLFSRISVSQCLFEDCYSAVEGGAVHIAGCNATVQDSQFHRTHAETDGGAIFLREGVVTVASCSFVETAVGALYLTGVHRANITGNYFERCSNTEGGAVEIRNVDSSLLANNRFENNTAKAAGAVLLLSDLELEVLDLHVVEGNEFTGNTATAYDGGAMSAVSVDLHLARNRFRYNSAETEDASGGALTVDCELSQWCNLTVVENDFQGNSAGMTGGAISWDDSYPLIANNFFHDNYAEYGSDIASFPVMLALTSADGGYTASSGTHLDLPVVLRLTDVASGQEFTEAVTVGLFDHLRQLIHTDDSSSASMSALDESAMLVYGGLDAKATAGRFRFAAFTMVARPGSTQYIQITTNGVDKNKKTKARDPTAYQPAVLLEVTFRLCRPGESLQSNECFLCVAGTYSLDPAKPCLLCPAAAVCYGNNTMVPKPGYWRIRNDTDVFTECLAPEACIGSPEPPFLSLVGQCAEGYSGNLCQSCIPNYSRTGRFQCSRCPETASNVTITTLVVLFALTVVALIIWTAVTSALKPQSLIAVYVKIFLNYLQMVVVSAALNLNWPTFAKTFLNGQQMAGGLAEQMFSFECLFQDASVSASNLFSAKLRIYAVLPVALFALAICAWGALACCRHIESLWRKLVATAVILLFMLHPSITKLMFSLFACMDLGDGRKWLVSDLSVVCWESDHLKQVLTVVMPCMIIYVFGLPMLSLLFLVCKRLKLESWNVKLMLCFLYKGYHRQRFYWEFVTLYRKVAMIAASVFLAPVSIRVQALTVLALLLFSLFLQVQVSPFFDSTLNRLEVKAILVSAITIYSGLYYDTDQLSFLIKISLFVLMVLANVYFLFSWLRLISPVLLRTIKEKLNHILFWRRKYRVRAVPNQISETPEKSSSSAAVFFSDMSNPRGSGGNEASVDCSQLQSPSYQDPANTSVLPREFSEPQEVQVHYTFVE